MMGERRELVRRRGVRPVGHPLPERGVQSGQQFDDLARLVGGERMKSVGELAGVDREIFENQHVSACHRIECGSIRLGYTAQLRRQLPVEARLGLPEDSDLAHQPGGSRLSGHLDEDRMRNTVAGQRQPRSRRGPGVTADQGHRRHGAPHDLRKGGCVEIVDRPRNGSEAADRCVGRDPLHSAAEMCGHAERRRYPARYLGHPPTS